MAANEEWPETDWIKRWKPASVRRVEDAAASKATR